MGYIGKITAGGSTHLVASTLYGTCPTGAATAAKVVNCANFDSIMEGVTIHVKFTNSNTAANPTLNVNSTGAKRIYRYGTTAPATTEDTSWSAGAVVSFTYDGDYWQMNDWRNKTYTAVTSKLVTTSVPNVTAVGTVPSLTITAVACDDITSWDKGSLPDLTLTSVTCDDITSWDANTPTTATVSGGVLTITDGTAARLSYTPRTVGSASNWSAGTLPDLKYSDKSVGSASGWSPGTTPTLGSAVTVATGATSDQGGGSSIVVSIT